VAWQSQQYGTCRTIPMGHTLKAQQTSTRTKPRIGRSSNRAMPVFYRCRIERKTIVYTKLDRGLCRYGWKSEVTPGNGIDTTRARTNSNVGASRNEPFNNHTREAGVIGHGKNVRPRGWADEEGRDERRLAGKERSIVWERFIFRSLGTTVAAALIDRPPPRNSQ
jgi:hypothetical protein